MSRKLPLSSSLGGAPVRLCIAIGADDVVVSEPFESHSRQCKHGDRREKRLVGVPDVPTAVKERMRTMYALSAQWLATQRLEDCGELQAVDAPPRDHCRPAAAVVDRSPLPLPLPTPVGIKHEPQTTAVAVKTERQATTLTTLQIQRVPSSVVAGTVVPRSQSVLCGYPQCEVPVPVTLLVAPPVLDTIGADTQHEVGGFYRDVFYREVDPLFWEFQVSPHFEHLDVRQLDVDYGLNVAW